MDLSEEHDKSTVESFFASMEEAWTVTIVSIA
jgi:hypothetical protein